MSDYSFHSIGVQGDVTQSQSRACRDDLEALAEGVRRSGANAVEIFDGDRLVARVKLGNAALNAADPTSL